MAPRRRTFDSTDALLTPAAEALSRRVSRGEMLVVAVSGGPDSTALLLALTELRETFAWRLTAAHFDHGWRDDSAADARWVADLCQRLDVPLVIRRWGESDPDDPLPPTGREEHARRWRRRLLTEIAREVGAAWVVLAHTADDQAETVLHRLLRGSGVRGLAGMAPAAPLAEGIQILRPLLSVRRPEIEQWLTSRGQTWLHDVTNLDTRYTRNRIRHVLLPLLRREFNPDVDAALCRLARQCRELVEERAAAAAVQLAAALLEATPTLVRLDVPPLAALPPATRREAFRLLWRRQRWPEGAMTFRHWHALAHWADAARGDGTAAFPGAIQVTRAGSLLRLAVGGRVQQEKPAPAPG